MGIRLNGIALVDWPVVVAAIVFVAERCWSRRPGGALTSSWRCSSAWRKAPSCLMAGAELSDGHWHRPLLPRAASLHVRDPRRGALLFLVQHSPARDLPVDRRAEGTWLSQQLLHRPPPRDDRARVPGGAQVRREAHCAATGARASGRVIYRPPVRGPPHA